MVSLTVLLRVGSLLHVSVRITAFGVCGAQLQTVITFQNLRCVRVTVLTVFLSQAQTLCVPVLLVLARW